MNYGEIKVGQVWRDRDRRMYSGNRRCRIVAIADDRAHMKGVMDNSERPRLTRVRLRNLRAKWELVSEL